jgi:uncharacterized protein (DUF362 family)
VVREPDRAVSRRGFLGLALGILASLVAACQRGASPGMESPPSAVAAASPTPTLTPIASPTAIPVHTVSGSPSPTQVSATVTGTPTPSPSASSTATEQAPTATALPATYTPVLPTPTSPPPPTSTPTPLPGRDVVMAHWPVASTSRVVVVRHGGVWGGGSPDPTIVLQMLDAGLCTLAGASDALVVWRILFDPGERILLKVNCIAYGGPTQPAVTYAVAQRLQDAGLDPKNLLIFDRTDNELAAAGYKLNTTDSGVRCHGSRGSGSEAVESQARVRFFQEIDGCDAIINLPTPKQHGGAGVSVSLKNHYGSVDRPAALHGNWCDPAIAELNSQPNIRNKTRLIVGAALAVSPNDWNRPERENALLLSFDPVALDTVARDILVRHRQALGLHTAYLVEGARHLQTAQKLNLGATDATLIDLQEVSLG